MPGEVYECTAINAETGAVDASHGAVLDPVIVGIHGLHDQAEACSGHPD